jgi:phosphatidylinositol glycan class V
MYHNYSAYIAFCTSSHPASWCTNVPPFIYTHVQSTYWNVGFLRYWTLQQLPNFIISAPPLILLFTFSIYHITHVLIPCILFSWNPSATPSPVSLIQPKLPQSPFLSPTLTPHGVHALVLSTTLLVASHTQIVLRLGPSMPIIYWAAAWLLVERPTWRGGVRGSWKYNPVGPRKNSVTERSSWGQWWVGWSVMWGSVSLVLWGTFLPPA